MIGLPLPEQLDKMANAVSHFADGTNKTAALTAINRGFIELLPLLDEGARGFEELKEKLEATNSKLDETTTGRLVEMQHGFVELGAAIRGDALQSFIPFIDSVNGLNRILIDLAEDFSAAVKNGGLLAGTLKAAAVQVQVLEQVLSAAIFGLTQFEIVGEAGVKVVIAGFIGLGEAIGDVFKVLAASVPAFFTGLVTAGAEAVKSVGNQFMGLGAIIGNTMILNFSGAKQAFTALGTDMVASGKRINDSFKGVFDFSAANEDLKRATDRMGDAGREGAIRLVKSVDTAAKEYAEIWGIKTKEVVEAHKAATPAINLEAQKQAKEAEKAARDALAATMEAAQGQVRATEDATKQQISAIDSLARRHQITEAQKVSMTVAALNDELKAEQSIVQKELELSNLTLAQKAKLNEQLRQMAAQNAAAIQKIQQEGIEKTVSDWRSYGDTVAGMINSQVNGVLRGTTSIAQAFKNMAASGIEDVIKFCIKWAAEHAAVIAANILGLTAQTGATVAATSAQTATIGVGVAAQKAINATTIQGDAARAAAGAYAAMAGVPLIGPVLAPAAAAVAFAGVEAFGSFDKGAWSVPADMVALIHQGEKVIPAGPPSAALDALAAGRGGQGGDVQASGGDMHLHVHATDAQSVAQLFRNNGRALAQTVRDVMNANQSLRTSF
ncbi:MAG: hypothetical protein P4L82_11865 [Ancalomicrobiaceae bacterium]|nr:hypothetical protein [Ancalomicrobiaceae bacterium]